MKDLLNVEKEKADGQSERSECAVAGFEGGGGAINQGRETFSPLQLPQECNPVETLLLAP